MRKHNIDELYRELEATDERYIRRKLLLNGYLPVQRKLVQEWLDYQEANRVKLQVANNLAITARSVYWTKVAAIGTVLGTLVTVVAFFR